MPDINEDFLRNPERFASLHALYPYATPEVEALALEGCLSEKLGKVSFAHIAPKSQVFYCDIRKSSTTVEGQVHPDSSPHESDARNQENYFVMWITAKPTKSTSFPVYFLPWKKNAALRMRLRSGTKRRPSEELPHIFVTAALQGCGLFVDGIPARPTVYHLNVIARDAGTEMKRLHGELEKDYPIEHGRGSEHREMLPGDYMPRHETVGLTNEQRYSMLNPVGWVFPRWNIQTAQRGTVFGRFDDGGWSFFRQTRTFIRYETYNWPSLRMPKWYWPSPFSWSEMTVRTWAVTRCHRFWPSYRACRMS